MVNALDLSERQATRLLEQAVRNRSRLHIEPQAAPDGPPLRGAIIARQGNVLTVELTARVEGPPTIALIGSFCEVRVLLSGELFIFTSYVLDVVESGGGPSRLQLTAPELVQVANRRRFERTNTVIASQVKLVPLGDGAQSVGLMANISPTGLGLTLATSEVEDPVLLGDDVRVQFELAGFDETFELPAMVCNKHLSADRGRLLIGLEFHVREDDLVARHTLARVHAMLNELLSEATETDGDA